MTAAASCCTACAAGLANGGAACETAGSGPAGAAEAPGVALERGVSPVAELSLATPALRGALGPAPHAVAAEPAARASLVARELAPARGDVVRAPAPAQLQPPPSVAQRAPVPRNMAPSAHLGSGIAMTMEEAHQLAASPQMSAGIAMTMEDSLALARSPASRAGLPPEPAAAVAPPPGNIALTMEHAEALARAPQFHQNIALTLEDAERLAKNPAFRAGINMTLEESLSFAEASQKNAAIALTMDDALALARSPASRAGLELYDRSSPDLMTNGRLSPEAVKAVLRGEHPVFPLGTGPSGPSSGPQQPSTGQFGKPAGSFAPVKTPLWFYNALWTDYDNPSAWGDVVDVGAGGGWVWAVTSDGQLWKLGPGSSRFEAELGMRDAVRVAVLSDGRPVVVTMHGSVEELFYETTYHWVTLWAYPANVPGTSSTTTPQDVGAGQTGLLRDLVVAVLGDRVVDLGNHHVVPVAGNAGIRAVAVAANGTELTRDGKKLPRLWAVGTNGLLYAGDESGLERVDGPWEAFVDVGVDEQGMPCVIAANGNAWQQDISSDTWLDAKGRATAIAAGPDRSMWLVGQDGKVYNRGGRQLGFWELGTRSIPSGEPKQTWCDFETQLHDFLLPGTDPSAADALGAAIVKREPLPALLQEGVARLLESGATTIRIGQSFSNDVGAELHGAITEPAALLVAATWGVDVFLLIDVIRTGEKVVPHPDKGNPGVQPPDYASLPFNNAEMKAWFKTEFSNFVGNVKKLFDRFGVEREIQDVLRFISVGGEVDYFLTGNVVPDYTKGDRWQNWIDFYDDVMGHIRELVPGVKVGSVVTDSGAQAYRTAVEIMNEKSDFFGFTSYPNGNLPLDFPRLTISREDAKGNTVYAYSVRDRIERMLDIAGDKPVVIEEFGYPTYDNATKAALKAAWPEHSFPQSFFLADHGERAQGEAARLAFDAWDAAKLRVPMFVWFLAFEQHIEGNGCDCLPGSANKKCKTYCNPCLKGVDVPTCHLCGFLDLVDPLGTGETERDKRFFGSCGLIRADGKPKIGWQEMINEVEVRKNPPGGMSP